MFFVKINTKTINMYFMFIQLLLYMIVHSNNSFKQIFSNLRDYINIVVNNYIYKKLEGLT